MKSIYQRIFGLWIVGQLVLGAGMVLAEDNTSAEEKAKEVHQLANSDVIYSQEETKAIYYQNIQIIDLLKQIRDILEQRLKETKG